MKGKFIVCEGLDCAGKTTTIKKAMECLEDTVYLKGLGSNTRVGQYAKRHPSTLNFLIELLYVTYKRIIPALRFGKTVIQDRYDISIITYPDATKWYNKLIIKLIKPLLKEPDLLVYFTVSEDVRRERLIASSYNKYHSLLLEKDNLNCREKLYDDYINQYENRKCFIDTTHSSIENSMKLLINNISFI